MAAFEAFEAAEKDGLLVVLEDLEPVVLDMVGTGFRRDAEIAAEEGGAELGDQLFHGVGFGAEAEAEIAVEAVLCARAVDQLVAKGRIEALAGARRRGAGEAAALRHADHVGGGHEAAHVAALLDPGTGGPGEALGPLDRIEGGFLRQRLLGLELEAIDLGGVEDEARPRHQTLASVELFDAHSRVPERTATPAQVAAEYGIGTDVPIQRDQSLTCL